MQFFTRGGFEVVNSKIRNVTVDFVWKNFMALPRAGKKKSETANSGMSTYEFKINAP